MPQAYLRYKIKRRNCTPPPLTLAHFLKENKFIYLYQAKDKKKGLILCVSDPVTLVG